MAYVSTCLLGFLRSSHHDLKTSEHIHPYKKTTATDTANHLDVPVPSPYIPHSSTLATVEENTELEASLTIVKMPSLPVLVSHL